MRMRWPSFGHGRAGARRSRWRARRSPPAPSASAPYGSPVTAPAAAGSRRLSGEELQLRVGLTLQTVSSGDYALIVGSRLVVAWRGSEALRDLNIASGVLTVSNKRNRYAVKDRFETAGRMHRALDWPVPMAGDAAITLGRPVAIRQQADG